MEKRGNMIKHIYRLKEYNNTTGDELIQYATRKEDLEKQLPTVSPNQEITKIKFDANDMQDLVNQLNILKQ